MILYSKQVIFLDRYKEPAIFLGYDEKDNAKLWAVCIGNDDKPEIDWFMEKDVSYLHSNTKNPRTPNGRQIFFGDLVNKKEVSCLLSDLPSDEEVLTMFNYVNEVLNKYKQATETKNE